MDRPSHMIDDVGILEAPTLLIGGIVSAASARANPDRKWSGAVIHGLDRGEVAAVIRGAGV